MLAVKFWFVGNVRSSAFSSLKLLAGIFLNQKVVNCTYYNFSPVKIIFHSLTTMLERVYITITWRECFDYNLSLKPKPSHPSWSHVLFFYSFLYSLLSLQVYCLIFQNTQSAKIHGTNLLAKLHQVFCTYFGFFVIQFISWPTPFLYYTSWMNCHHLFHKLLNITNIYIYTYRYQK